MAVCNVQDLITAGKCYYGLDAHKRKVLLAQMLCNKASAAPTTCDIQTLLNDAKCLFGLTDAELDTVIFQLLCDIL